MAVDMFLKLKGIDGESQDAAHTGWIDILSWSWNVSHPVTGALASGSSSGKVDVADLTVTKYCDKSTGPLLQHCAQAKHIPDGEFHVRKHGDKPMEYLKWKFEQILVSNFSTGGAGNEKAMETVSLNMSKCELDYFEQKPDGSPNKAGHFGWNIKKNIPV